MKNNVAKIFVWSSFFQCTPSLLSTHINKLHSFVEMHWSLWGVSHLGLAKLVNWNQILDHVADQNYIPFIDGEAFEIFIESLGAINKTILNGMTEMPLKQHWNYMKQCCFPNVLNSLISNISTDLYSRVLETNVQKENSTSISVPSIPYCRVQILLYSSSAPRCVHIALKRGCGLGLHLLLLEPERPINACTHLWTCCSYNIYNLHH